MQCSRRGPHSLGHDPISWEGTVCPGEGPRVLKQGPRPRNERAVPWGRVWGHTPGQDPVSRDKPVPPGTAPHALGQDPGALWLPRLVGDRLWGRIDPPGVPCPAQPRAPGRAVGPGRVRLGGDSPGSAARAGTRPVGTALSPGNSAGTAPGTIPSRISVLAVPGGSPVPTGGTGSGGRSGMSGSVLGRSGSSCSILTLPSSVIPLPRSSGWGRPGSGKAPGRAPPARRAPHRAPPPLHRPGGPATAPRP